MSEKKSKKIPPNPTQCPHNPRIDCSVVVLCKGECTTSVNEKAEFARKPTLVASMSEKVDAEQAKPTS